MQKEVEQDQVISSQASSQPVESKTQEESKEQGLLNSQLQDQLNLAQKQENTTTKAQEQTKSLPQSYKRIQYNLNEIQCIDKDQSAIYSKQIPNLEPVFQQLTFSLQLFDERLVLAGGISKTSHYSTLTVIDQDQITETSQLQYNRGLTSMTQDRSNNVYIVNGIDDKTDKSISKCEF